MNADTLRAEQLAHEFRERELGHFMDGEGGDPNGEDALIEEKLSKFLAAALVEAQLEALQELANRYKAKGYRQPEMLSSYMADLERQAASGKAR